MLSLLGFGQKSPQLGATYYFLQVSVLLKIYAFSGFYCPSPLGASDNA